MGGIAGNAGVGPGRYARALAGLAAERGRDFADEVLAQTGSLLEVLEADAELAALMTSPRIPSPEKIGVLRRIFGAGMAEEVYGLLSLLLAKGRGGEIKAVLERFRALAREQKRVTSAEVSSAVPLTAPQLENIRKILEKRLGKTVEITAKTDPSLIGGLRVAAGGMVADSTIKSRLNGLKKRLLSRN